MKNDNQYSIKYSIQRNAKRFGYGIVEGKETIKIVQTVNASQLTGVSIKSIFHSEYCSLLFSQGKKLHMCSIDNAKNCFLFAFHFEVLR